MSIPLHRELTFKDLTGDIGTVSVRFYTDFQGPVIKNCEDWDIAGAVEVELSSVGEAKFGSYSSQINTYLGQVASELNGELPLETVETWCDNEVGPCFIRRVTATRTNGTVTVNGELNVAMYSGSCPPEPIYGSTYLKLEASAPGPTGWDLREFIENFDPDLWEPASGAPASITGPMMNDFLDTNNTVAIRVGTDYYVLSSSLGSLQFSSSGSSPTFTGSVNVAPIGAIDAPVPYSLSQNLDTHTPTTNSVSPQPPFGDSTYTDMGVPPRWTSTYYNGSPITSTETITFEPDPIVADREIPNGGIDFDPSGYVHNGFINVRKELVSYGDNPACRVDVTYTNRRPFVPTCSKNSPNILQLNVKAETGFIRPAGTVLPCRIQIYT